jgi:hypothetical protein
VVGPVLEFNEFGIGDPALASTKQNQQFSSKKTNEAALQSVVQRIAKH